MVSLLANELSTVSIPFSNFALTRDGLIVDDQRPLCKDTKVHRVGFILADRKVIILVLVVLVLVVFVLVVLVIFLILVVDFL